MKERKGDRQEEKEKLANKYAKHKTKVSNTLLLLTIYRLFI